MLRLVSRPYPLFSSFFVLSFLISNYLAFARILNVGNTLKKHTDPSYLITLHPHTNRVIGCLQCCWHSCVKTYANIMLHIVLCLKYSWHEHCSCNLNRLSLHWWNVLRAFFLRSRWSLRHSSKISTFHRTHRFNIMFTRARYLSLTSVKLIHFTHSISSILILFSHLSLRLLTVYIVH
jgi:hypothetical protein